MGEYTNTTTRTNKKEIPPRLKKYNLQINRDKTEEYHITRNNNDTNWKNCKILGSLIDTKNDINRRITLAITAYKTLNNIFKSNHSTIKTKIRIYNAYILPILTYNCEIWTLTKKLTNKIECFHRKQLRRILKYRWPRTLSNINLYRIMNTTPLNITIRKRRLSWFGHLMRLNPNTPARKSLLEFFRNIPKPRGRHITTYFDTIKDDLTNIAINFGHHIDFKQRPKETIEILSAICEDRKLWARTCVHLISSARVE